MQICPNNKMGEYVFLKKLGSGEEGTVYLVKEGSKFKAIKVVSMEYATTICSECSIYSYLDHPNIIKPEKYLFSDNKDTIYMIMEAGDMDLDNYLKINQSISRDEALIIFWQILNAIDYIHKSNVIHRDLKPNNIVKMGDRYVIIDFGLSKYIYKNTDINDLTHNVQSPIYSAPEVILNQPYDSKIDIWSLGCILFQLITGEYCIYGNSIEEINNRILDPIYIQNRIYNYVKDRDIQQLLIWILTNDPRYRPKASDIMNDPIFKNYKPIKKGVKEPELLEYYPPKAHIVNTFKKDSNWAVPDIMIKYASSVLQNIGRGDDIELLSFLIIYIGYEFKETSFDIVYNLPNSVIANLLTSTDFNLIMDLY